MYCIRKYADCWMVFNLDSELGRRMTDQEIATARQSIETLQASDVRSYFTDHLDWMEDKP